MTQNKKQPAVFVDRDGTLVEEVNFLSRVEDLRLFPFTGTAVERLKEHGLLVIVVTNQSGIGRKLYNESDMHTVHEKIQEELSQRIDGFYFCPHLPDEGCACRKPNPGMIERACEDFEIDLERSWIVGDKRLDIETGFSAGMRTAMVMTGYGAEHISLMERPPDIAAAHLGLAVDLILRGNEFP